jgi:hypothetical protein
MKSCLPMAPELPIVVRSGDFGASPFFGQHLGQANRFARVYENGDAGGKEQVRSGNLDAETAGGVFVGSVSSVAMPLSGPG